MSAVAAPAFTAYTDSKDVLIVRLLVNCLAIIHSEVSTINPGNLGRLWLMAPAFFPPPWHLEKQQEAEKYSEQTDVCLVVFPGSSALQRKIGASADPQLHL